MAKFWRDKPILSWVVDDFEQFDQILQRGGFDWKSYLEDYKRNSFSKTTEKLIFQQDSSRIFTDARVKITSGSGIFYGKGLESNSSFTRYKILEPTGDIYFDDNESSLPSSNGESQ